MINAKKSLRTCPEGHQHYKNSDCSTCPFCEQKRKPEEGFLTLLSAPAQRALEKNGITTLSQLATYHEKEILKLHGIGPSSLPKLRQALATQNLTFKP